MATEVSYNGDGNDKTFDITFPFIKDSHVKVSVGGATQTVTSDYSISGTVVTFVTAPVSGTANVKLYRDTPIDAATHDYSAGSSIKSDHLNENQLQALYAIEEAKLVTVTSGGITTGSKNDVTVNSDSDWVINNNAIEQAMMADNSVGLAEIKPDSVGTSELVDNSVGLAQMAGGTDGQIITYDASGDPVAVGPGNDGEVLTSTGAGSPPAFEALPVTVPIGTVIWYAGSTAPGGYLKCNGDAIANGSGTTQGITANFAALHAIVGNKLPDIRGEFVRGETDGRSGVDESSVAAHTGANGPTFSTTGVLRTQTEGYKSHAHDNSASYDVDDPGHYHDIHFKGYNSEGTALGAGESDHAGDFHGVSESETTGIDIDVAITVEAEGQAETRPRNIALLACIKY